MTHVPGPHVYTDAVRRVLGRALSRLDAEPTSVSHGSFDRTWWCWKFSDMSAPRFQEGVYLLAWLCTSPASPAGYRGSDRVLRSAEAAARFWQHLQHPDGSFDEAYPFERSLAATAFTSFYVCCAVERLAASWSRETSDLVDAALSRAAGWLSRGSETHAVISNHLAAAAAALQAIGDRLGTDRYCRARDRFLDAVLQAGDHDEGWLREYDGADPGYQSHAMFYLAEVWKRTGSASLEQILRRGARFLSWFVHPDGTLGGEYASRGTTFAYPAAFEMLAALEPAAAAIAVALRRFVADARAVGPEVVDAWNLFPLVNTTCLPMTLRTIYPAPPHCRGNARGQLPSSGAAALLWSAAAPMWLRLALVPEG